ncbi:MAG: PAS domain-containing sensor histidine kinase [Syntrophaceae bacterium]|nr:PAS domain-containing sensor histidine kinase [Syntrophaceae bacterium]
MSFVDTSLESLNWQIAFMRQELDHLRALQKELRGQARVCFENSAKLEAIFRAFDGFIYVCSANYEIEYMNDKLIERTGYNPVGKKCFKTLHGLDDICDWCVNDRVLQGETVRWEIRSPKDNRYYYVVNTPIYYPDGSISKMSMIQDVTDQKTGEIEREELIAQLKAKNSDLEVFSYAISHDLRGPIITIKGLLKWIERDAQNGNLQRLRQTMTTILRSADRMEELITDLLKLSRVATIEDERQELAFEEIAREAIELLAGKIAHSNVEVEIQENLPSVHTCRNKLLTILQNLIENAVKYMGGQTEPRITIGAEHSGDEIIFFVKDNGIGIDTKDQVKIFKLFVKLDEKSEGTGIGLAMLKRILESENGRIWVESEGLGHGCRFCFTLSSSDNSPIE